jgi:hypothetical protein
MRRRFSIQVIAAPQTADNKAQLTGSSLGSRSLAYDRMKTKNFLLAASTSARGGFDLTAGKLILSLL